MTDGMDGTVSLVTGAGSGLGEALARELATSGSAVACLDIRQQEAERVCRDICDAGGKSLALGVNLCDTEAVIDAVRQVNDRWGRLDVAVNAAGYDHVRPVAEMSVEQWDEVIGVNLRGAFLVAREASRIMQGQHSGAIVNVASTAATRAWANAAAYHASKWGLVGFSRGLGVEGREFGIRVTTVIPGGMRTHFFDRFPEQGIPMPDLSKLQDPTNVARAIVMALQLPPDSVMQEMIITPLDETSWP